MDKAGQDSAERLLGNNGYRIGSGKAVNAGIGGSVAVLSLYAIGRATGAVEVPEIGLVTEAISAVVVAAIAGAGIAWRTWAVPFLNRAARGAAKSSAILLAMLPLLGACETLNARIDEPGPEGFRLGGVYVYAMIPALNYMRLPDSRPDVAERICTVELTGHNAAVAAIAALEAGGDGVSIALAVAGSALADVNLIVFDSGAPPAEDLEGEELVDRSIVLGQVAIASAVSMRAWRAGYLRPKLDAMAAEERDPAPAEWAELRSRMAAAHEEMGSICP